MCGDDETALAGWISVRGLDRFGSKSAFLPDHLEFGAGSGNADVLSGWRHIHRCAVRHDLDHHIRRNDRLYHRRKHADCGWGRHNHSRHYLLRADYCQHDRDCQGDRVEEWEFRLRSRKRNLHDLRWTDHRASTYTVPRWERLHDDAYQHDRGDGHRCSHRREEPKLRDVD